MALFFFVAGLEIRREFDMGELRERRRLAAPVIAAVGGMIVPALLYLAINAGADSMRGWGIVVGTDTAFALGVLSLSRGVSPRVRTFLLTLVIIDDAIALTVIAVAYTDSLSPLWLLIAVAAFGLILALRAAGVRHLSVYALVAAGMWLAVSASGLHATIAGVAAGLVATAYPPGREGLRRAGVWWHRFRMAPTPELAHRASRSMAQAISPNELLQRIFHPWSSYLIVPLFALANAGLTLDGNTLSRAATSPITLGIIVGLVLGKMIGIVGSTWLASRPALGGFPLTVSWPNLIGASAVAGIGFTVSLLIADISFAGDQLAFVPASLYAGSAVGCSAGTSSPVACASVVATEEIVATGCGSTAPRVAPCDADHAVTASSSTSTARTTGRIRRRLRLEASRAAVHHARAVTISPTAGRRESRLVGRRGTRAPAEHARDGQGTDTAP
ncbi:hypothetical protein MhomT_00285 [Microbacterium hominis]|nr:hypothetical protein MhomT_00285 [Microbacterium hominis]